MSVTRHIQQINDYGLKLTILLGPIFHTKFQPVNATVNSDVKMENAVAHTPTAPP